MAETVPPGTVAVDTRSTGSRLWQKVVGAVLGIFIGSSALVLIGIIASMDVFMPSNGVYRHVNHTKMSVLKTLFAAALDNLAALYHGDKRTAATGVEEHRGLRNGTNSSMSPPSHTEDWSLNIEAELHLPVLAHAPYESSNDTSDLLAPTVSSTLGDIKNASVAPNSAVGNQEAWSNNVKSPWPAS